jgi:hypothetical protein
LIRTKPLEESVNGAPNSHRSTLPLTVTFLPQDRSLPSSAAVRQNSGRCVSLPFAGHTGLITRFKPVFGRKISWSFRGSYLLSRVASLRRLSPLGLK